jgi:hypothetical protein
VKAGVATQVAPSYNSQNNTKPYYKPNRKNPTMSNYDPVIHDLERALDKLRQDRDDWKDLAEKAIAQIEEWRALCDIYQDRYNQIVRGN